MRELFVAIEKVLPYDFCFSPNLIPDRIPLDTDSMRDEKFGNNCRSSNDLILHDAHQDIWEYLRVTFPMAVPSVNSLGTSQINLPHESLGSTAPLDERERELTVTTDAMLEYVSTLASHKTSDLSSGPLDDNDLIGLISFPLSLSKTHTQKHHTYIIL